MAPGEVGALVALIRKRHQGAYPVEYFCYHSIGCFRAVLCYVFADLVKVVKRFGVECKSTHGVA
jgi:hypothetical protein